jgi:hypothetical protein
MTRDAVNRAVRTLAQGHVVMTFLVMLKVFGVPITSEQIAAAEAFALALGGVVLAWNAVEDSTGRSFKKE